jgi:hypothetical protein
MMEASVHFMEAEKQHERRKSDSSNISLKGLPPMI